MEVTPERIYFVTYYTSNLNGSREAGYCMKSFLGIPFLSLPSPGYCNGHGVAPPTPAYPGNGDTIQPLFPGFSRTAANPLTGKRRAAPRPGRRTTRGTAAGKAATFC